MPDQEQKLVKRRKELWAKAKAITKRLAILRRMPTKTSKAGIASLRRHEGVRLVPYDDSRGFATTGVGHLIAQRSIRTLSLAERNKWTLPNVEAADRLLAEDLKSREAVVLEAFRARGKKGERLGQSAFDALVSFTFNIGNEGFRTSTAATRVRDGATKGAIGEAMMMWSKPPEIIGRRRDEVALLRQPD